MLRLGMYRTRSGEEVSWVFEMSGSKLGRPFVVIAENVPPPFAVATEFLTAKVLD